ncbi:8144_t:CDS:2 [Funneliformis geosporum]|nr:8144_t:CDS:2 [Funneliformis geosporum]
MDCVPNVSNQTLEKNDAKIATLLINLLNEFLTNNLGKLNILPKGVLARDEQNKKGHTNKVKKSKGYREVALKSLNDSQNITTNFLNEIVKHKMIDDWFNNIVPCYGLSEDLKGNYIIVMQYIPKGSLRNYLSDKKQKLSLVNRFNYLIDIAQGLKDIHQKDLIHRDFHSGNILKGIEETSCLIADLGLCKPINEINQEKQVFGVMPYVAPEVLRNCPYTQTSDIYSFGIIAYEVLSRLPPYYDVGHDLQLALSICRGQRPKFKIRIPQLLEDLIKRCKEFKAQLRKAEKYNETLSKEIGFPNYKKNLHHGAVYISRLLPTKEISERLLYNSKESSEQSRYLEEVGEIESCAILNEFEENQLQAQIEQPPKQ